MFPGGAVVGGAVGAAVEGVVGSVAGVEVVATVGPTVVCGGSVCMRVQINM